MRILLVDDHRLFREAIGHVLAKFDEDMILLEAGTVEEAINIVGHYRDLDLILLDLSLPGIGGLAGLPRLLEGAPTAPIVVVSGSLKIVDVQEAIRTGAAGYIPKTFSGHELFTALQLVLSGEIFVPPQLLSVMSASQTGDSLTGNLEVPLTPRQMDVLQLVATGLPNKLIADRLQLSEGTIKLHVNAILRALNTHNRTAAVAEAERKGLIRKSSLS